MRSPFQQAVLASLASVLAPLARLMLRCGVGCPEFVAVTKAVFVQVATDEYGIRGRPANASRVAAITGLSRKQVRRIKDVGPVARWTPDMEATPTNVVLHYWHFDPEYSEEPGRPRWLPFDGDSSFSTLVRDYAGDIPPRAMLKALMRVGAVSQDRQHRLLPEERYFNPNDFDEDFVHNAAFALRSLGTTLVYNATVWAAAESATDHNAAEQSRFERVAWTDRLSPEATAAFKVWVRIEGAKFIEEADNWIGNNEATGEQRVRREPRAVGVGLYYFEDE